MKTVKKNMGKILAVLAAVCMMSVNALAALNLPDPNTGDFRTIIVYIGKWTGYLGAAIAFFGAVQLAMGFRSDDAEGKNKGMRSMIAGFIVLAIGLLAGNFVDMAN